MSRRVSNRDIFNRFHSMYSVCVSFWNSRAIRLKLCTNASRVTKCLNKNATAKVCVADFIEISCLHVLGMRYAPCLCMQTTKQPLRTYVVQFRAPHNTQWLDLTYPITREMVDWYTVRGDGSGDIRPNERARVIARMADGRVCVIKEF